MSTVHMLSVSIVACQNRNLVTKIIQPSPLHYYCCNISLSLAEEKRHREEVCGDLGRRVREGEEAGGKVREERIQLAGQLQKVREQLRSEAQTREEAEARAKQEVCVDRRRRGGGGGGK